jgi:hypothetical protein
VVELEPRPLRNLLHVDDIDALNPLLDAKLIDLSGGGAGAGMPRDMGRAAWASEGPGGSGVSTR